MTSTQKVCDLRIVLLGKSGSGKSATGNTILGREAFEAVDFINSANKLCEKQEGKVCGKIVSIIDTPGLFNTAVTEQQLKAEIEKCVEMSFPGPHVFLLVLKLGVRFTKEERDAVKGIRENFGDEALRRTIILFTHADQLKGKPVDEYINKSNNLMEIVDSCGGRYHSFNNKDRKSQEQVTELMTKIDAMMEENKMNHYTLEMFKTTQIEMTRKETNIKSKIIVLTCIVLCVFGICCNFLSPPLQLPEMSDLQKKPPPQLQENDYMCSCSANNWCYYRYESNSSSRKFKAAAGEDDITDAKEVATTKKVAAAGEDDITDTKEVATTKKVAAAGEDDITDTKEVATTKKVAAAGEDDITDTKEVATTKKVTAAGEDDITDTKEVATTKKVAAAGEDDITDTKEVATTKKVAAAGDDITDTKEVATTKKVAAAGEDDITDTKEVATIKKVAAAGDDITDAKEVATTKKVAAAGEDDITDAKEVAAAGEDDITDTKEVATTKKVTDAGEDDITDAKEVATSILSIIFKILNPIL